MSCAARQNLVSRSCWRKLSPVDLVIVEGWKVAHYAKIEVYRQEVGKPPLHPDDPYILGVASDVPFPNAGPAGGGLVRSDAVVALMLEISEPLDAVMARLTSPSPCPCGDVMAQLTDDCFAFSGPLLPIGDMERMIAERIVPLRENETVALNAARGRVLAADVVSPVNVPPFDNSAVDGYAVRAADLDPVGETRLTVIDRIMAGHGATSRDRRGARRRASLPAHLCRMAQTRSSCRRMSAPKETRSSFRRGSSVMRTTGLRAKTSKREQSFFRQGGGWLRSTLRWRPRPGLTRAHRETARACRAVFHRR